MQDGSEKLYIEWQAGEDDMGRQVYALVCADPEYASLHAQVYADEVSERTARAKLIAMVFELAREQGIDTSRLRFHV